MRDLIEKITRKSRKISDIFILAAVISFLLALLGQIIGLALGRAVPIKDALVLLMGNEDAAAFALEYFLFIGMWIVILAVIVAFPANRKMLKALAYNRKGNSVKALIFGAFLGFAANGICVLASVLAGDIVLSFNAFDFRCILVFIIVIFVQSGAEELVDRLYLYQKLRRRYKWPAVAIVGNAVIFTAMHAGNPGFSILGAGQIFIVAIIFSMLVYYYGALWMAMAFHMGWNFTQSIIFGLPNSGIVSAYSIFNLDAASARDGLFYSVNFGVEGSIGACLVLALVGIAIYLKSRGRSEENDIWAEDASNYEPIGKHAAPRPAL